MFVMSIALGGCLKAPPIEFGLTEDTGGHVTYVLGAAMALAKRADVDAVEIITRLIVNDALGTAYAIPLEQVSPKLVIRRLDSGNRSYLSKEKAIADRPAFLRAIVGYIEGLDRKPDLIHAHFADAGDIALELRRRFGIPFVYTAHSLGIDKLNASAPAGGLIERVAEETRVIAAADAIVASSRDEAERQLMLYPEACPSRVHRITPGAGLAGMEQEDLGRAAALVAPFLRDPAKPMILAIARPVMKKNLTGLVDLYAEDDDLRARANLVIVAGLRDGRTSGEEEQSAVIGGLLDRLDAHNLYGSLALPKRHDQQDVSSLYGLARQTFGVFANPAFTEPYGLTLAEAALHGLPVVATNHGGAQDIVRDLRHGLVADPRAPTSFADAIRSLLDDRARWTAASTSGRDRSRTHDWDLYAKRFMAIAASIVGRTPLSIQVPKPQQLLLCDIDETVTGCRSGARELVGYLQLHPTLAFGVAAGCSLQEAERLLEEWGMPKPAVLITSVGSEIYWRSGNSVAPDDAYAHHISRQWKPEEIVARLADLRDVRMQPSVEQRRYKRSYFVDTKAAVGAVRAALADLPVKVVYSHGNLLDVLPDRAGKGPAMIWAARRLGIPRGEVFAAGDSGNDLDMLTACRNAILVANHSEDLTPLLALPTVYLARRPHAGGIVDGMRARADRVAA